MPIFGLFSNYRRALASGLLAVAALSAAVGSDQRTSGWRQKTSMPLGVISAAGTMAGGRLVVTGGLTQTGTMSNLVQVYDPKTDKWTAPLSFDVGRIEHVQITLPDGRILIVGGEIGELGERFRPRADGYVIDLEDNSVTSIRDAPAPFADAGAHLLDDGRVLVVGHRFAELYDPAKDRWVQRIQLREERKSHGTLMLDDGRVLVVGGVDRDTIEVIDVDEGVSKMLRARLPLALDDLAVTRLPDGRIWISGGQNVDTGDTTSRTWVLTLAGGSRLDDGPDLQIEGGVADHLAAVIGDKVIVAGGETQTDWRDTELAAVRLLDPSTMTITALPDMFVAHDDAVSVVYGGGMLVVGGMREMTLPLNVKIPGAVAEAEYLQISSDNAAADEP